MIFMLIFVQLTKDELLEICSKYGQVDVVTVKTKVEEEEIKSRGIAVVQYAKKESAAEALKKLPYVDKLGEPGRISILFYESKESRMQLTEQRQR